MINVSKHWSFFITRTRRTELSHNIDMKTLIIILLVLLFLPLILNLGFALVLEIVSTIVSLIVNHPFISIGVIAVIILALKK